MCIANLLQSCIDKRAHLSGKLLHAHILHHGFFSTDTFICNRLIELYSKCNNTDYAGKVFDNMPRKNIYSWNAILSEYCKVGLLDDAHRVFLQMSERNTVSWNNLISASVRGGFDRMALDIFDEMIREGFVPTRFTLASVLSACGALLDLERARKCHGIAFKIGLGKNIYVGNALLSVYAKCGFVGDAARVFEDMPNRNAVTFTAMMSGLAHTDRAVEALEMFRLMRRKGIHVDSVSLSSVLGVCAREACGESSYIDDQKVGSLCNVQGKQVHGIAIKLGCDTDIHLSNSLLDMYAKSGDMDSAEVVFSSLPEVTVFSWNVMIAGYGQIYQVKTAMEHFQRMQVCGFEPDQVTCINMLAACLKTGDMETAHELFDSLACVNVSSWNSLLTGYFHIGNHREVTKLFKEMQIQNVQPDRTTLTIVLSSCGEMGFLEAGKQLHAISVKIVFHIDVYVGSGLIGMYSKCGKMDLAYYIFKGISEPDIVCWNTMITGFSINSLDKEAFTFFKQMRQYGMSPTQFSYATILNCCAKFSSSHEGKQVHAQVAKEGTVDDIFVGSALVDMYCKCGDVDAARNLFDVMPCKNTITWNEMTHGYAQNGRGDEAVQLYREMIGLGEQPDEITFVTVLTACSHSGLVDTGLEIFDSMQQVHGVEPVLDHYTCIIDALGRAGRFHEAETLIDKIPYKDDPIVWEVLLSSCRVHANVRLAKRAAEELCRLEPQNSASYVLLANVYTSLGRWDDARAARELMSDKQVTKEPGYSRIVKMA